MKIKNMYKMHEKWSFDEFSNPMQGKDHHKENVGLIKYSIETGFSVRVENVQIDYDNEIIEYDLIGTEEDFKDMAESFGDEFEDYKLVKI